MRVGILTQYFPPEIGAPQTRLSDLALRFKEDGHDVFVYTAMPNYPKGKVYEGYGGIFRSEVSSGVQILRSFIYPTKDTGLIKRLFSYFSFVFSSLLIGFFKFSHVDYLLTESPPLFLGISGYLLYKIKGERWIFNVSDLWPESAVNLGVVKEGACLKLANKLEAFCYKHAWLVSGQSKSIVSNIKRRFPNVNTYHLSNGTDTVLFSPNKRSAQIRESLFHNKEVVGVYAGLHGIAQGLVQIVEASSLLSDLKNLGIFFIGDGPEKENLRKRNQKIEPKIISFVEPMPKDSMPALLSSADFAIIPLKHYIPGAVPSKTYEAMAAGLPIVMIAEGEAAYIVQNAGCGIVLKPGDIKGIAAAIRTLVLDNNLRQKMAANGRKAVERNYNRQKIASDFIKYLKENFNVGL